MMAKILNYISGYLDCRVIPRDANSVYLKRYRIFGWIPGIGKREAPFHIYLHRFCNPDSDPGSHDHPWKWSFSIILSGSYSEERISKNFATITRIMSPGKINILRSGDFHRISQLHNKEVWTLFVAGKKFKPWGFIRKGLFEGAA